MPANRIERSLIVEGLPAFHSALIDIVGAVNRPERDAALLASAGLELERALFPLLVLVDKLGPIKVADLAGRVGRDYSTVSRQLARLDELGLVDRQRGTADLRTRYASITAAGAAAARAVDVARERLVVDLFSGWSAKDFTQLIRLMRRLADELDRTEPASGHSIGT